MSRSGRLDARRLNLLALAAVGLLLVLGYVLVPHWSTRYAAALLGFSVWMAWFVVTVARLLAEPVPAEE